MLLRLLVNELTALGLTDVTMDEHGYVMATVPATTAKAHVPVIGFIAHVDTSPEMPGQDVTPIVHERYDGRDLVLPDDPSAVLRAGGGSGARRAASATTSSPRRALTLLGADDKAGVAADHGGGRVPRSTHPEIPHGTIRVGFTPDEEIGRGADHFDVGRFGAVCAYTLDGGGAGELEWESFSADAMTVTFKGFNTHPGYAKGRMVNAIKLAADFIARLPEDRLSPETTDGYDGYVHPYVDRRVGRPHGVRLLIRDFAAAGLEEKEAIVEELAREVVADYPQASGRDPDRRVLPQHARHPRGLSRGHRVRARGDPAQRADADRAAHPRRHRRVAPVVHGPADAEPLCRRAQLSLAARVGLGAGDGQGGRDDRQSLPRLGRAVDVGATAAAGVLQREVHGDGHDDRHRDAVQDASA